MTNIRRLSPLILAAITLSLNAACEIKHPPLLIHPAGTGVARDSSIDLSTAAVTDPSHFSFGGGAAYHARLSEQVRLDVGAHVIGGFDGNVGVGLLGARWMGGSEPVTWSLGGGLGGVVGDFGPEPAFYLSAGFARANERLRPTFDVTYQQLFWDGNTPVWSTAVAGIELGKRRVVFAPWAGASLYSGPIDIFTCTGFFNCSSHKTRSNDLGLTVGLNLVIELGPR